MIQRLLIKNYAIIDDLEINFSKGLTIITGETGAGKSILLGALGLIMGKRADTKSLYDQDKKCIIAKHIYIYVYSANIVQETTLEVKPYQKSSTIRMSNRHNHFLSSHNPCSNKIGNNHIQHVYHMTLMQCWTSSPYKLNPKRRRHFPVWFCCSNGIPVYELSVIYRVYPQ